MTERERRFYIQRSQHERRNYKHNYKPKKPSTLEWLLGVKGMCRRVEVCPKFERRSINGVDGACIHCEYLKKEKKQLIALRIALAVAFITFLTTTYILF